MKKRKLAAILTTMALGASVLSGCSKNDDKKDNKVDETKAEITVTEEVGTEEKVEDKYSIVCTTFPQYDWAKEVIGDKIDNYELTLLLDNGVDLHSYQPTVDDIKKIGEADMFIYVGGESDGWVDDALKSAENKDLKVINLLDSLGDSVKEEELKEGMQESEHEHDHDHEESEAHKKEVSTFEDDEVQDRTLNDWAGEWQSAYPFVLDGSLDKGFEHKAESGKMTAEEYKEYYKKGYESDIANVKINGDDNTIEYTYVDGKTVKSEYKYNGYYIQNWSTGTKAAMYRFEAVDKESGAPVYIEFNDHIIEPVKAEHFHFRSSDTSYDDIEDPENRWPTFFPGSYDADEILDAFIGHDHKKDDDHDEAEEEHEDHDDHDEAEEADHDDHDEDHDEDHDDGHHHEEGEVEYDEHVWLSLKNAKVLVNAIEGGIEEIDPANKDSYKTNADSYVAKLDELDKKYEEAVKNATNKTVVFGDRFPFRYLVDDYSIDYFAAFVGCSAESEASFETIAFLAGKIDELGLKTIFVIENSDKKIAETVKASTKSQDQSIVEINSLQSITSKDIENGVTYLGTMEKNLEALSEGLK